MQENGKNGDEMYLILLSTPLPPTSPPVKMNISPRNQIETYQTFPSPPICDLALTKFRHQQIFICDP